MLVICVSHRGGDYLITLDKRTHEYKLCSEPWAGFGNPLGEAIGFDNLFNAQLVLNLIKLKIKASNVTIKDTTSGREI